MDLSIGLAIVAFGFILATILRYMERQDKPVSKNGLHVKHFNKINGIKHK